MNKKLAIAIVVVLVLTVVGLVTANTMMEGKSVGNVKTMFVEE
jgi:hypothetical protein